MTQQIHKTYFAQGTHCTSCQVLIERHVGAVPGVSHVRVDFRTGAVRVQMNSPVDDSAIAAAIRAAGYEVGQKHSRSWFSGDTEVWVELLVAGCLVFTAWLFASAFGLTTLVQKVHAGTGVTGALVAGLLAGVSTCMALVGGLVLSLSARHAQRHPEASAAQKFRPHLFFNIGRLASFALLGGLLGSLGSWMQLSVSTDGWLIIIAGLVMLLLGLSLTGVFPRLGSGLTLPAGIARRLGLHRETREYSHRGAVVVGALTFFLPCGFTQAAQVAAVASGSFWGGMSLMAAFAIGTAPGLLGIGGLASIMRGSAGRLFFRAIGIIVILLGLWNLSNGWHLTGIILGSAGSPTNQTPGVSVAPIENGVQVVRMNQWQGGYGPNAFVIKKGVPVRWEVTSTSQYTCASTLTIPTMGIRRDLSLGLNVIEFTPTKTGALRFTCGMGMFSGTFTVIN